MIKNSSLLKSKSGYTEFLSAYSFGAEEDVFYSEIFNAFDQAQDANEKRILLGVFISTLNKKKLLENYQFIQDELMSIYSDYGNDDSFKFLDFVISQDFGKLLSLEQTWFNLIFGIVLNKSEIISDEMAAYTLKTLASSDEVKIRFFKEISYEKFMPLILSLMDKIFGRSGGLLREVGFNLRRLPDSNSIKIECLNIFDYIQKEKFNSQLRYSVYCIFSKIFNFNKLSLVKLLLLVDRNAAEMIFSVQKGSKIAWSKIQRSLWREHIAKFNEKSISTERLSDFYSRLNKISVEKIEGKEKIGVILTTHNPDLAVIQHSINSVLQQAYSNLQLCIVDDFSDQACYDALSKLVSRFQDPRIRLVRNEKNVGQYISRNIAMELMSDADFYAIQDDDDVSHPERIKIQLNFLKSTPDAVLCLTQQVRFNKDMVYVPDRTNPLDFDFGPASSFFRKNIIKKIGGFMNVRSRGDVEFINRIKNNIGDNGVGYLMIPLYIMRSDLSTVSTVRDFQFKTQIDVYKKSMRSKVGQNLTQFALSS